MSPEARVTSFKPASITPQRTDAGDPARAAGFTAGWAAGARAASDAASVERQRLAACRAAGFEPTLGQPAPQFASILSLVSAEQGVSLVPESMQQLNLKGIVFRKIRGSPHTVNLAIALQRTRPPQLSVNFVNLARAVSGHF